MRDIAVAFVGKSSSLTFDHGHQAVLPLGSLSGSHTVVNAVSLYVERGNLTFDRVHVKAAADPASASRDSKIGQFIQISEIGSDPRSESSYIRARGQGEHAVMSTFPSVIIRPSVMIGPHDAFLTVLVRLIRLLPVLALCINTEAFKWSEKAIMTYRAHSSISDGRREYTRYLMSS